MLVTLCALTIPALGWIADFNRHSNSSLYPIATIIWAILITYLFIRFNFQKFEATQLSLVLIAASIVAIFGIARVLIEGLDNDFTGLFFLMALVIISLSTAVLCYVRKRIREVNTAKEGSLS